MKRHFLHLIWISLLMMTGCKKDEPVLTSEQLLAGTTSDGKSWGLMEQSLNGNITVIGSCSADDVTTFYLSLTYLLDEGPSRCDPNDPQTISGGWVLDQNNTHLLISNGTDITDFEILLLTANLMTLKTRILDLEVVTTYKSL